MAEAALLHHFKKVLLHFLLTNNIAELHAAKIRLTVLNGCIKKEKGLIIYQPFFNFMNIEITD